MWRVPLLLVLAGLSLPAWSAERGDAPPAAFAVVFIDAATEQALGEFPYDRRVYARGIEALAKAGARGVVLKFFIDRKKSVEGDAALADAMTKTKVILQARLDPDEQKPNAMLDRFYLKDVPLKDANPMGAWAGWLPLPMLSERAYDLGFLDSTDSVERVPVVERYGKKYVKSLYTAALELAIGSPAKFDASGVMRVGEGQIKFDDQCMAAIRLPKRDALKVYSFLDLLNGKVDAAALKDRVVILGYDGAKMEENVTPIGKVKGHRLFCYQLFSLYEGLDKQR